MIMLSPIFMLSIGTIVLLFLIFFGKFSTKQSAIFTSVTLLFTLLLSLFIGYQLLTLSQPISDNRQIALISPTGKLAQHEINKTGDQTDQTVNIQAVNDQNGNPIESESGATKLENSEVTDNQAADHHNSANTEHKNWG